MVNDKRAGTVVSRSRDTELLELTRSDYFRVLQQKDTLLVSCTSHVDPIADITIPQSITCSTSVAGLHMEGVSAVCLRRNARFQLGGRGPTLIDVPFCDPAGQIGPVWKKSWRNVGQYGSTHACFRVAASRISTAGNGGLI